MATISKRHTGSGKVRYRAIVRLEGLPAQSKTFGSLKAAERWALRLEDDIRSGAVDEAWEARRRTVAEACRRWIRERQRDTELTVPRGREAQLDWWRARIGTATLASLTPAKLRAHAARLDVSGATRNRYLAAVSAVLESARRDWGWMRGENPAHAIRKWPEHPGRVRMLTQDELTRLLDSCRASDPLGRVYDLAVLALVTGARQGELLAIQLRDLHLDGKEPYAILEAREAGARKTRDRRKLELIGEAVAIARRRAEARRAYAKKIKRRSSDDLYLFGTTRRGRPSFPAKCWKAALEAAKIEDFRFHDLRHCAVSYLVMSGASLRDAMDFAGHRTTAMSRRYSHLTSAHLRKIVGKMSREYLPTAKTHDGDSQRSQRK